MNHVHLDRLDLEMREFFLDSSGAIPFTSTSPETQAGYLQYILEVVGSQNESVKNPILRAGDIATWYSPNRSVLQATTSVAPEVRRAAIETSTMLAREVGLRAVQEKTAEVALKLTVNFGKLALRQLMAQPVGLGYPGAMPGMTRATPNSAAVGRVPINHIEFGAYHTLTAGKGTNLRFTVNGEKMWVDMWEATNMSLKRQGVGGRTLFEEALRKFPGIKEIRGIAELDNLKVLRATGDIHKTEFALSLKKLGFTRFEVLEVGGDLILIAGR